MKIIRIEDHVINVDKIIQIYEEQVAPNSTETHTIIEIEGIQTGNIGPYGETPYYTQNRVTTKKTLKEVCKLIYDMNELSLLRQQIANGVSRF